MYTFVFLGCVLFMLLLRVTSSMNLDLQFCWYNVFTQVIQNLSLKIMVCFVFILFGFFFQTQGLEMTNLLQLGFLLMLASLNFIITLSLSAEAVSFVKLRHSCSPSFLYWHLSYFLWGPAALYSDMQCLSFFCLKEFFVLLKIDHCS